MTPSTATRGVTILGATGSIGTAALRVIDRHRDRFHVRGLTAHSNATLLAEQVAVWRPAYVGLVQGAAADWNSGAEVLVQAATSAEVAGDAEAYCLNWLLEEVSTSINTAAAGGNASLIAMGE